MTRCSSYHFYEPMDYLRSLLHVNHSSARPSSAHTISGTTRGLYITNHVHLSPPLAAYDDTESPPFLPRRDDCTSLNQMGTETPAVAALSSTFPRRYSGYSSPERDTVRARSHPSSPLVDSSSLGTNFPRRRSSVPASVLRRNDKRNNTPQEIAPSVRFDLDNDSLNCPEEVSTKRPSFTRNSEVVPDLYFNFEDLDPELVSDDRFCNQTESRTSPNPISAKRSDELECDDGMSNTTLPKTNKADTDPGSHIPSEIRLVHPFTIRRRFIPSSLLGEQPFVGSVCGCVSKSKSGVEILPKSRCVSVAMTHASVRNDVSERNVDGQHLWKDDGQRKFSETKQIVRSNDSAYEVIWEDVPRPVDVNPKAPATYSTSSSVSPDSSKPLTPNRNANNPEMSNLEQVNTKLTAWSWARGDEPFDTPKSAQALRKMRSNDNHLASDVSRGNSYGTGQDELVTTPLLSIGLDDGEPCWGMGITEQDGIRSLEEGSLGYRDSIDHVTTVVQPRLDPCHNMGEKTTQQLPKSNAQKRRELMGKRKVTNILPEDERFASHRDSLMLARMRIFHDDSGTGPHQFKAIKTFSTESEAEQLKRSTWS